MKLFMIMLSFIECLSAIMVFICLLGMSVTEKKGNMVLSDQFYSVFEVCWCIMMILCFIHFFVLILLSPSGNSEDIAEKALHSSMYCFLPTL